MKIYWTQQNIDYTNPKVMHANLDGSTKEELVTDAAVTMTNPAAIALAPQSARIFWSDSHKNRVWRANPDGSNVAEILHMEFVSAIYFTAVDEGKGKIYWADVEANRISRANLDGTDIEDLIPHDAWGIALDVTNQHMYFAEVNRISRANLDGSNPEELVSGLTQARGIALDLTNGHLYWTSIGWQNIPGRIQRADLDGTNIVTLVDDLFHPFGIALDLNEGKIYWTDVGSELENIPGRIQRANLDGSNIEDIITDDVSGATMFPHGIAIGELTKRQDFRFEYAAKLLCGIQRDPQDMRLAPGFYATTINIHNPHNETVSLFKKLALTFPPGEQRPGKIMPIANETLGSDEALAVDCVDIHNRLFPDGFPTPYIEGFVVIQSSQSLDVTAVYTTAAVDERGQITSHSSIHIQQIRERDRARVVEEATDLGIRKTAIVPGIASTMPIRYKIYITNYGPGAAHNVIVKDTLQIALGTLISVPEMEFSSTHGGSWSLGQVTESSAELEATIPLLPPGEQAVLEFVVVVQINLSQFQAELINSASVTSDAVELNPNNNSVVLETSLHI